MRSVNRFFKPLLVVIAVTSLVITGGRAAETDAGDDAKPSDAERREADMLSGIPMDETFQGLRIPHMGPDGNIIMLLDTKSAKRVDEDHIEMDDLRIEFTDDDGKTFVVTMPVASFNLTTRILSTEHSVKIERDDFIIDGDGAEFDTRNRFGRVTGNVKMLILDTENLDNE